MSERKRTHEVTELLGQFVFDHNNELQPRLETQGRAAHTLGPAGPVQYPSELRLKNAIMVTDEDDGKASYVVRARAEASKLLAQRTMIDAIGDPESVGPEHDAGTPALRLCGDYPALFLHLAEYAVKNPRYRLADAWNRPGIFIALAPNTTAETHGMVGVFDEETFHCRVFFYSSKAQGIQLLNRFRVAGKVGFSPDVCIPYVERSTLPKEAREDVTEVSEDLARWLVHWYIMYASNTGKIG